PMQPSQMIRRRNLPHWDVADAPCFLTTCLEGSIPAQGLLDIRQFRDELGRRPRPANLSEADWKLQRWKRAFARTDDWLDRALAVRHLADERLAQIVVRTMFFFAGERYDLLAYVVMPSHVHWVFQPIPAWVATLPDERPLRTPRERIQQSFNRHSASECNQTLGRQGAFWQHESYDHWVRDADELERIIHYVEANPVKAGLATDPADWL